MDTPAALIRALITSPEAGAEAIAQQIIEQGPEAVPSLRELLAAEDPDLRWWAVRTLAEIQHPDTPALLRAALHDPDRRVQQCAALGLRLRPDPGAIPDLRTALQAGDRLLARLAADALVAVGSEALPTLLDILAQGDPQARLEAMRALAMLRDPRAVAALFAGLDDESPLIRYWADLGLERLGIGMMFFKP